MKFWLKKRTNQLTEIRTWNSRKVCTFSRNFNKINQKYLNQKKNSKQKKAWNSCSVVRRTVAKWELISGTVVRP